jgi:LppP/LprE lipoprotein
VLFFNRNTPLGTPTPDPRPYITVTTTGNDTAVVQYQWRQGQDAACCPTGIGTMRFKIEDGKLKALDPIRTP